MSGNVGIRLHRLSVASSVYAAAAAMVLLASCSPEPEGTRVTPQPLPVERSQTAVPIVTEETTDQASGSLILDTVYVCEMAHEGRTDRNYWRFFDGGAVMYATSYDTPAEVAEWLLPGAPSDLYRYAVGEYDAPGDILEGSVTEMDYTITFQGSVDDEGSITVETGERSPEKCDPYTATAEPSATTPTTSTPDGETSSGLGLMGCSSEEDMTRAAGSEVILGNIVGYNEDSVRCRYVSTANNSNIDLFPVGLLSIDAELWWEGGTPETIDELRAQAATGFQDVGALSDDGENIFGGPFRSPMTMVEEPDVARGAISLRYGTDFGSYCVVAVPPMPPTNYDWVLVTRGNPDESEEVVCTRATAMASTFTHR